MSDPKTVHSRSSFRERSRWGKRRRLPAASTAVPTELCRCLWPAVVAGVVALRRTLGAIEAMEDSGSSKIDPVMRVSAEDFSTAIGKVQPSVSIAQRKRYEALRRKFAGLPVRATKEEVEKAADSVQES